MTTHDLGTPGAVKRLAVVSDGSAFRREAASDSVLSTLLTDAALLREDAGVDAVALLVSADRGDDLVTALRQQARDHQAIYLCHTKPSRADQVELALQGAIPVLTDRQTSAIALTTAVLTTLARAHIPPAASHVVIAGTEPTRP